MITIKKNKPLTGNTMQLLADKAGILFNTVETSEGVRDFVYDYWLELEGHRLSGKALEKYTKLVVQECLNMVNTYVQHNNPHDSLLALGIKDRFGVQDD